MSAKIITLNNVKRGPYKCSLNGVAFPELYRLTGYNWDLREGVTPNGVFLENEDDLVPGTEPVAPSYTLEIGSMGSCRIAKPRWEPISRLSKDIDSGWIIVRHHIDKNSLEAYIDAMCDTATHEASEENRWRSFETPLGYFSVHHRQPNRGTPDHLLIFTTKVAHSMVDGPVDWSLVIGPDGETRDIDETLPPEVHEELSQITDIVNKDLE